MTYECTNKHYNTLKDKQFGRIAWDSTTAIQPSIANNKLNNQTTDDDYTMSEHPIVFVPSFFCT